MIRRASVPGATTDCEATFARISEAARFACFARFAAGPCRISPS
jgi:hypothetical protein